MSIFDFLKQKKIKRLPRNWQFYAHTKYVDFKFKTKNPYGVYDEEKSKLWNHALVYMTQNGGRDPDKETFFQAKSKNLILYVYHCFDGRRDYSGRWGSSFLMLELTPEESKKYSLEDFANEIYAKKSALKIPYPTSFDLADKFPVTWDETETMESTSESFLSAHPNASDDSTDDEDFEKDNKIWMSLQKKDAVVLSKTFTFENNEKNK